VSVARDRIVRESNNVRISVQCKFQCVVASVLQQALETTRDDVNQMRMRKIDPTTRRQ